MANSREDKIFRWAVGRTVHSIKINSADDKITIYFEEGGWMSVDNIGGTDMITVHHDPEE